jgi:predicted TIM-barrel fold metal-dependent hydrolase
VDTRTSESLYLSRHGYSIGGFVEYKILDYETYWRPGSGQFGNLDALIRLFDEVSDDYRAVIFPPSADIHPKNKELFAALKDYPQKDRFIPCAYINPNLYDAVDELACAVQEYGFRGVKLMPTAHRYLIDSQVTHPVMEKCRELDLPVTIHSSSEGGYPHLISKLAAAFSEVPIIMDHSGYRYFQREALEAGRQNENLYFGLSCVIEPSYIDRVAKEIGVEQVIFGSNAQGGIPKIGVLVFHYTRLSEADKALALGKNLARLFKISL